MKCPIDGTALVIAERSGVEIDYCPQCRGVWLDRGELDKIIERSAQPAQAAPQPPRHEDRSDRYDPRYSKPYKKKSKKNFLEDLFDF